MFATFHRFAGLEPARMQPTIDDLERNAIPSTLDTFGCLNAFVLVDWDAGAVTTVSLWDDEDRMRRHDRETEEAYASLEYRPKGWRTEPRIERHEIVHDARRFLELGHEAAAA
ncbi:hypothetical protein [Patulibacter minatonensis]|uniref:hypothetical protein n=1 Tax=Patulibacter minatonensis TaxID=298163 RepID=UPI00047B9397|nr:hypothetical protein [Patulibacter minatonensis]